MISSHLSAATALTKALADEHRLRILMLLNGQELCACQIVEAFELANSSISKHLSILRQAGLIHSRKQGRWVYYSLPAQPAVEIRATLNWLQPLLQDDKTIHQDQKNMAEILKIDPAELCQRQNSKDCC